MVVATRAPISAVDGTDSRTVAASRRSSFQPCFTVIHGASGEPIAAPVGSNAPMEPSLPAVFGAGLLSFASPCVLPMVPIYLATLSGASVSALAHDPPRARLVLRASAFARRPSRWASPCPS